MERIFRFTIGLQVAMAILVTWSGFDMDSTVMCFCAGYFVRVALINLLDMLTGVGSG